MPTLGDRIRKARKAKGLTQAEVGAHFGISSQAVSQWENDPKKGPERDRMPALAKLLDCDLAWLAGSSEAIPELLEIFEGMSKDLQERAIRLLKALAQEDDKAA